MGKLLFSRLSRLFLYLPDWFVRSACRHWQQSKEVDVVKGLFTVKVPQKAVEILLPLVTVCASRNA